MEAEYQLKAADADIGAARAALLSITLTSGLLKQYGAVSSLRQEVECGIYLKIEFRYSMLAGTKPT